MSGLYFLMTIANIPGSLVEGDDYHKSENDAGTDCLISPHSTDARDLLDGATGSIELSLDVARSKRDEWDAEHAATWETT